jgi:hypothetical protein
LTAEQLEASRIERMRLNGSGALTFEDARTWLEETGLCLFLPRKQHAAGLAPSFVEAVAGQRNPNPDAKHVALAEELLVRLEKTDVAVRLNLLGQPGEQPDFVVAAWVLPYVYALRGDRDWRRTPQLTGSRQVSPLAVQAYKLLEAGEATIPQLKHTLGREVSEAAVLRAITELWQQLRIIPVTEATGKAPRWQLLRVRFQKAIAEGASTSQVTAISVLASIYLQAVIAGTMEDVELFLSALTARSKVREVLRGLVATRQVHTLSLGHAPHFYVAGTLPEFTPAPTIYSSSTSYFLHSYDRDDEPQGSSADAKHGSMIRSGIESRPAAEPHAAAPYKPAEHKSAESAHVHRPAAPQRKPAPKAAARPHFSRPAVQARDRKPAQSSNGHPARHAQAEARGPRWTSNAAKHTSRNGNGHASGHANGSTRPSASSVTRSVKAASVSRDHAIGKAKPGASRSGAAARNGAAKHSSRPHAVSAGVKPGGKRYGLSAPRSKKRG